MNGFADYIDGLINTTHLPITFSGEKSNALNRWMVKSEWRTCIDYTDNNPVLSTEGKVLPENDLLFQSQDKIEKSWRYCVSDDQFFLGNQRTFFEYNFFAKLFSEQTDKVIYSLCNVYCLNEREITFFIFAVSPLRMWVNGELVFTGNFKYHTRPYCFTFHMKQGNNSILVEQTSFLEDISKNLLPKEFTIKIQPSDFLMNDKANYFFDKKLFEDQRNSYFIFPNCPFFDLDSDIGITVLPKYYSSDKTQTVRIKAHDTKGKELCCYTAGIMERTCLEIDREVEGIIRITAEGVQNPERTSELYVFRGVFEDKTKALMEMAQKKVGLREEVLYNIKNLIETIDLKTGFIKGSQEIMLSDMLLFVMKRIYELEMTLNSDKCCNNQDMTELLGNSFMQFDKSEIDDSFTAYSVYMPKNFCKDRKYPLVIFMFYGFGLSTYPDLVLDRYPERQEFIDSVMISIPARGGLNRDYINEVNYFNIIERLIKNYSIDRERIFIVGSCTGAMEGFGLALKMPHLFAAVAGNWSTPKLDLADPDFSYLHNADNVMTYHLLSIEDSIFNYSRLLYTLKQFKSYKYWSFYNFSHIEADMMIDYRKLVKELTCERSVRYPREVNFNVCEPIFNKAYWVQAEFVEDLSLKGIINAEIAGSDVIRVHTENIGKFSLMVNAEMFGLEREIELIVNDSTQRICLPEFSKLTVKINGGNSEIRETTLTTEEFYNMYNDISIDENLMGIRQVYLKRCIIVRPDKLEEGRKVFEKRLFISLRQPLKERKRNYRYDLYKESELEAEKLGQSNFIYFMDTRNISQKQRTVLDDLGVHAGPMNLEYGNMEYTGNYFAFLKYRNPYSEGKFALVVLYNGETVENELLDFLNSFDTNGLFYSDAVIYCDGHYSCFREMIH